MVASGARRAPRHPHADRRTEVRLHLPAARWSAPTGSPTCWCDDIGLVPGNRVLLRGPNNPMMAACWLAVIKAGCIAVATMPLLRAEGAEADHRQGQDQRRALRHAAARGDGDRAGAMPGLKQVHYFNDGGAGSLEALIDGKPAEFANVDTAADDVALIAFTSGTTGQPKGTMHFHRDVMAMCDCFPRSCLKPARTTSSAARRRSRSPSGWAGCCASRCASARRPC